MKIALATLLLTLPLFAQTPAPATNLAVKSATNKAVALTWTAGAGATSYLVERRPLGSAYVALTPAATATTFTDTTFDAFETYTYRVTSQSATGSSVPSGEVEIGPPPVGFNVASPVPNIAPDASEYGRQLQMALDGNGDPAIVFLHIDPNDDGDSVDTILYFVGWDRANYRWKAPVKVDVPGDIPVRGSVVSIQLACDASTGMLGIAYSKGSAKVSYASSTDNGNTWTVQDVPNNVQYTTVGVSFKMGGGKVYLEYLNESQGMAYFTGSETSAPSTWTRTTVPLPIKNGGARSTSSMALDINGKPALAFIYDDNDGPSVGYWRPGDATSLRAVSIVTQNDDPDLRMTFYGTQPRLALYAAFSSAFFQDIQQVWAVQSTDTGTTWLAPVALANDGKESWGAAISIAVNSSGFSTILASVDGGSTNGVKCGEPKWAQSSDFKTWATCSPQGGNTSPQVSASYPSAAYAANDKIYIGFQNDGTVVDVPRGIILYREPVAIGAQPAPLLLSGAAVNGASFVKGGKVAPGSIISIFGSNLATAASGSGPVPLATAIGTTTVSIGGVLAPLYYISPLQINAQVPMGTPTGDIPVRIVVNGLESNSVTVPVATSAPGIFTYGSNHAVAQHPLDLSLDSADNPSKVGNVIVIYATGQGPTLVNVASGAGAPTSEPLARASLLTTCTIGGKDAPVQFAGLTPGLVGLLQVNVVVPQLTKGDYPMILTIGGVASAAATVSITP